MVAYNKFTALFSCNAGGTFQADYCCDSPGRNCCTIATFDYGTTGESFKPGMDQLLLELANINSSTPMTITVTATATGSLASQTESRNSTSASSSSSSNIGTAVGAGVGVPLGVLAVGILGFLFYRERRHSQYSSQQTESRSHTTEMEPSKTSYMPQPPPQPLHVPFAEVQG